MCVCVCLCVCLCAQSQEEGGRTHPFPTSSHHHRRTPVGFAVGTAVGLSDERREVNFAVLFSISLLSHSRTLSESTTTQGEKKRSMRLRYEIVSLCVKDMDRESEEDRIESGKREEKKRKM